MNATNRPRGNLLFFPTKGHSTYKGLVQRAGFLYNAPAGTSPQVFPYRYNYTCERIPVGMYLQADKSLFFLFLLLATETRHPSGGVLCPGRGARGGAGRPHKMEEKRGY
jgi:hypothetical protein